MSPDELTNAIGDTAEKYLRFKPDIQDYRHIAIPIERAIVRNFVGEGFGDDDSITRQLIAAISLGVNTGSVNISPLPESSITISPTFARSRTEDIFVGLEIIKNCQC